MDTLLFVGQFLLGLLLVVKGADFLTDGASSIARKFRVSSLVIGLTVVAFGTSAPELAVSCVASVNGNNAIALGNAAGSNIFNIFAIVGVTALVCPIPVTKSNLWHDVPLCILASLCVFVMSNDILIDGKGSADVVSRSEGIVLLFFFLIFLFYTFAMAKSTMKDEQDENISAESAKPSSMWLNVLFVVGGLAALVWGGDMFVDGASGIARVLGMSEAIIAITIVAFGTSMPELVTSIVAARKGDTDMALGNVIGSNIFNAFFVIGVAATVSPISAEAIGIIDYVAFIVSPVLLWVFCRVGRQSLTISRPEGAVMLLCVIAYYTYSVITAI